eukprot:SAG31_NODE_6926_length_1847_cov_1.359268_2_plen_137_part_01
MLSSSDDPMVRSFLESPQDAGVSGRGRKPAITIGLQFKGQLAVLIDRINATQVHYIRCVKPNAKQSPVTFDPIAVAEQLRCQGILEAIRIARASYPARLAHLAFLSKYLVCLQLMADAVVDEPMQCRDELDHYLDSD